MGLLDKFKKNREEVAVEDFAELPIEVPLETEHVKVMIETLDSYAACDRILRKVRGGNIVIAKIRELKETNLEELKQSISKIKTVATHFNGDIAGVGDDWLIITPSLARIHRG